MSQEEPDHKNFVLKTEKENDQCGSCKHWKNLEETSLWSHTEGTECDKYGDKQALRQSALHSGSHWDNHHLKFCCIHAILLQLYLLRVSRFSREVCFVAQGCEQTCAQLKWAEPAVSTPRVTPWSCQTLGPHNCLKILHCSFHLFTHKFIPLPWTFPLLCHSLHTIGILLYDDNV